MTKPFLLLILAPMLAGAPQAASQPRRPASQDLRDFPSRVLAVHNRHRAAAGVPRLTWDRRLAAEAARYGPALGALGGRLAHSPRAGRRGQGENLWMGTAGVFAVEAMVGSWADERRYFRPGIFPAVSTTRNWADVGHYTQMIWRGTTHLGCALHRSRRWDYLICRYAPSGNVDGRPVP